MSQQSVSNQFQYCQKLKLGNIRQKQFIRASSESSHSLQYKANKPIKKPQDQSKNGENGKSQDIAAKFNILKRQYSQQDQQPRIFQQVKTEPVNKGSQKELSTKSLQYSQRSFGTQQPTQIFQNQVQQDSAQQHLKVQAPQAPKQEQRPSEPISQQTGQQQTAVLELKKPIRKTKVIDNTTEESRQHNIQTQQGSPQGQQESSQIQNGLSVGVKQQNQVSTLNLNTDNRTQLEPKRLQHQNSISSQDNKINRNPPSYTQSFQGHKTSSSSQNGVVNKQKYEQQNGEYKELIGRDQKEVQSRDQQQTLDGAQNGKAQVQLRKPTYKKKQESSAKQTSTDQPLGQENQPTQTQEQQGNEHLQSKDLDIQAQVLNEEANKMAKRPTFKNIGQRATDDLGQSLRDQQQKDLARQAEVQQAEMKAKAQLQALELEKEEKKKEHQRQLEEEKKKRALKFENVDDLLQARRRARYQRRQERKDDVEEREKDELFEVGDEGMYVEQVAERLAISQSKVIATLFIKGIMAQQNQVLDKGTIKLVAAEFGAEVLDKEEMGTRNAAKKTHEFITEKDFSNLISRPPVVTVMGHVDHGKTSLLDYIRKSRVAAGEAGGITQAIGAYNVSVNYENEKKSVCFLDTPGHEAFSAMRARGTKVTDIAIIICACDDGVQPQTIEAVNHARAAQVPIVVALNKIDKEGANIERAKQDLSNRAELLPEEWGGDIPMIPISAKSGQGVDQLLETVILVSEFAELMANPKAMPKGTVIEAHLDKQIGPVISMVIQNGTLRVGDIVSCGPSYGKIRSMINDQGQQIQEAPPSQAVQATGLDTVPNAGDIFQAYRTLQEAQEQATLQGEKLREKRLLEIGGGNKVTLTSYSQEGEKETIQRLNIVLKADAQGSVEALKSALLQLPQENVMLRFLHTGPGEITQADVDLIAASKGMLMGFNLGDTSEQVQAYAKRNNVQIRNYDVIYQIIDDVRAAMEGKLRLTEQRDFIGKAIIKAKFGSGAKAVGGCTVEEGKLEKNCIITVYRKKQKMFEGRLISLKRFKDNVSVVQNGLECGVGTASFHDWQEGDNIEAFATQMKRRTLEEAKELQQLELEMAVS